MLRSCQGDMFRSGASALVCPTNAVGVMGAGLAERFARETPGLLEGYRAACRRGQQAPGRIYVHPGDRHAVICVATKRHFRDRSRVDDVALGLIAIADWIEMRSGAGHRERVALPALGCGLGGCSWQEDVAPLVARVLGDAPAEVLVFGPR